MKKTLYWLRALVGLIGVSIALQVAGQAPSREERLAQWLGKTDWPNGRALLNMLRAELPGLFLAGVGHGAKLGPKWAPGNPHWEIAAVAVREAIQAEELRAGPVLPRDAASFARVVATLPFTDDDIAFLDKVVETPYGRAFVELLDHILVASMAEKLIADQHVQSETKQQLQLMRIGIRDGVGAVVLRLAEAKEKQADDAAALDDVVNRAGMTPEKGEAVGRMFIQPMLQRLAGVLLVDTAGTIRAQVNAFRAGEDPPGARKDVKQ